MKLEHIDSVSCQLVFLNDQRVGVAASEGATASPERLCGLAIRMCADRVDCVGTGALQVTSLCPEPLGCGVDLVSSTRAGAGWHLGIHSVSDSSLL